MQHFNKHSRTRLLALCLCAGLVMGGLSGCGSQGQSAADTVVETVASTAADTTEVTTAALPEGPEESTIYVEPVDGISDDFYRGMDASAVLALENSGVKYYNFDGEEQDVFLTLAQAGVDVGMVQVGNEINNGMCGETDVANVRKMLTAGSKAVREVAASSGKNILVAVHYTNIDDMKKLDTLLTGLQVKEIDYDIVGLSFYPYWHGTMEDLKNAITHVRDTYDKKVYVAENAYCYTSEDGDGSANSIKGTDDLTEVWHHRSAGRGYHSRGSGILQYRRRGRTSGDHKCHL